MNHYTNLQSINKFWFRVCRTIARSHPQNSNHFNYKGWLPNLLLLQFLIFCLFIFAVFILDFELRSISFTLTIALKCTVFDLVFDAVANEIVFKIFITVVDWVTVSMSIISWGTIWGCLTVFLGGVFELWDCWRRGFVSVKCTTKALLVLLSASKLSCMELISQLIKYVEDWFLWTCYLLLYLILSYMFSTFAGKIVSHRFNCCSQIVIFRVCILH